MTYCSNCGSSINPDDMFCSACGEQVKAAKKANTWIGSQPSINTPSQSDYPSQPSYTTNKKLYRDKDDKIIAGVCGGIAKQYNIDPTLVRIGFIIFALIYGSGILIYILLALMLPQGPNNYK